MVLAHRVSKFQAEYVGVEFHSITCIGAAVRGMVQAFAKHIDLRSLLGAN